jgi:dipeptidyl aminopeptidase/acylaminoacyl peptidase
MFHNLLTDLGYTVLRYSRMMVGRDFRTGIYRFMGGKDLSDQIDGKKYLVENLGINEKSRYVWWILWRFHYFNGLVDKT